MKIGIIGSGSVAQMLGTKLAAAGHTVTISSRDTTKAKESSLGPTPSADEWAAQTRAQGLEAAAGSFAEAAAAGELIINATPGGGSLEALRAAGAENLGGKILVDLSNPLDFSQGMPPILSISNTDSVGEQIQAAFPETRVVKTLNTVTVYLMVDPGRLPEETDLFVAGNDVEAKEWVTQHLLRETLGWKRVTDLGDITASRGAEMYLPLWLRLWGAVGTGILNVRLVVEQS
jgi:predicted dinucleotide-binding enzyme